jgi:thiol-disulfide isomerase/thioredoxin
MKKKNIIIITIISIICITIIIFYGYQLDHVLPYNADKQNEIESIEVDVPQLQFIAGQENKQDEKALIEIATSDELRNILQNSEKPSVIFLYMDNCGWCKKVHPIVEQMVKNPLFSMIDFYAVDGKAAQAAPIVKEIVDQNITGFPSFIFMNKGKYIDKQVGFLELAAFEAKLQNVFNNKNVATQTKPSVVQNNQQFESIIKLTLNSKNANEANEIVAAFLRTVEQLPNEKFVGFNKSDVQYKIEIDIQKPQSSEQKQNQQPEKKLIEVTAADELRNILTNNQKPSVVFLYMNGCGWCKKVHPIVEQMVKNPLFSTIDFYAVDGKAAQAAPIVKEIVDQNITGFPSFIFMDKGKYLDKQVGFLELAAFEAKLQNVFNNKNVESSLVQKQKPSQCQQASQQKEKIEKPTLTTNTSPEALKVLIAFVSAADQLPDHSFNGFHKIEDATLQAKVNDAYEAYKKLYEYKDKFCVTLEENNQIKQGARKLFNLQQIRNMVWRGHIVE